MVKERAVEIFVEGDEAGIQCRKTKVVAVLEFFPIQTENFRRFLARGAVPAVGEDHSADIPEHGRNFRQRTRPPVYGLAAGDELGELCLACASANLGHRLYNNIRELLQTFFRALRQMQPDSGLAGDLQRRAFRQCERQLQLAKCVSSARDGYVFGRVRGNNYENSICGSRFEYFTERVQISRARS